MPPKDEKVTQLPTPAPGFAMTPEQDSPASPPPAMGLAVPTPVEQDGPASPPPATGLAVPTPVEQDLILENLALTGQLYQADNSRAQLYQQLAQETVNAAALRQTLMNKETAKHQHWIREHPAVKARMPQPAPTPVQPAPAQPAPLPQGS